MAANFRECTPAQFDANKVRKGLEKALLMQEFLQS
jgi:hypothetical protein